MIDRLVHHADVLTVSGDSYRTRARRELLARTVIGPTTVALHGHRRGPGATRSLAANALRGRPSGAASRAVMAREVLLDRDVVVPQLLAKSEFLDELEALAEQCGVAFREVWLRQDPEQALERLKARAAGPMTASQRSAHRMLARDGGAESIIPSLHHRLVELERHRPTALPLNPTPDDLEATYRALLALLDPLPGVRIEDRVKGQR